MTKPSPLTADLVDDFCVDVGTDDFLSKPVNKLELITRVRSLLRVTLLRKRLADLLKDASDTPTA